MTASQHERCFVLYSTSGCHLCEEAKDLVHAALGRGEETWEEVDIADDAALIELYGVRIPVVKSCVTGAELGWPFNLSQLQAWLQTHAGDGCGHQDVPI